MSYHSEEINMRTP